MQLPPSTALEHARIPSETEEEARITALIASLRDWFNRHREMHCFLAIDPSQRDLTFDDLGKKNPLTDCDRADIIIAHEAFPELHCPYLLALNLSTPAGVGALAHSVRAAFEDRRPESMAEGLGQRIGGWLASTASLEEVAAHWSRVMLQRDDSGRACVLRFFDSRALALLWGALPQAQRRSMLGPVQAWHVLDAGAKPAVYLRSSEPHARFTLPNDLWQEVHRHGSVNRALALHARTHGRQPLPDEIEAALAASARADRYELSDREDQVAFIGHALAWHPQFDRHPAVAHLLEHRSNDDFYTSAIDQLSADQIDDIRRGDWYRSIPSTMPR